MLKNTIKVKGNIKSDFKQKGKKYYLTIYTSISNDKNSKSLLYVELDQNMYSKVKDRYKNSNCVITGEIQAKKTKNDVPFIYLKCNKFELHTINKADKKNKRSNFWYDCLKNEKLNFIETSKVILVEREHLKGELIFHHKYYDENNPIAVRKLDNGNYGLVMGFKEYSYAKLLNKPKVKAFITELNMKQFREKYFN